MFCNNVNAKENSFSSYNATLLLLNTLKIRHSKYCLIYSSDNQIEYKSF